MRMIIFCHRKNDRLIEVGDQRTTSIEEALEAFKSSTDQNLELVSVVDLKWVIPEKNPHLPDRLQTGNPGGTGDDATLVQQIIDRFMAVFAS